MRICCAILHYTCVSYPAITELKQYDTCATNSLFRRLSAPVCPIKTANLWAPLQVKVASTGCPLQEKKILIQALPGPHQTRFATEMCLESIPGKCSEEGSCDAVRLTHGKALSGHLKAVMPSRFKWPRLGGSSPTLATLKLTRLRRDPERQNGKAGSGGESLRICGGARLECALANRSTSFAKRWVLAVKKVRLRSVKTSLPTSASVCKP